MDVNRRDQVTLNLEQNKSEVLSRRWVLQGVCAAIQGGDMLSELASQMGRDMFSSVYIYIDLKLFALESDAGCQPLPNRHAHTDYTNCAFQHESQCF